MGRGPGVRPTSESSIQIDFTYQHRRCRERIALAPTPRNIKHVKRLKATIDYEIATNTFDYAKHFPNSPRARKFADAGTALSIALPAYIDGLVAELEPETVKKYRYDAEATIEALGAGTTLKEVTRAMVRTWTAKLSLSKKRLDNLLTPLRGALRQAVEDGELAANPLADFRIRRTGARRNKIDPFTPSEVEALSKQAMGKLWQFWAWAGPRSGEIIGLEWQDVSEDCRRVRIRRSVRVGREKATKTASGERTLVLLPAAFKALASLTRGEARTAVFANPNTGERMHEDRVLARAFAKDCAAAKVRYRYPYQLRHTFATWALSAGENPAWIARQLGHADVTVLFKVYGKWMPSLDPKAGAKMVRAVKSMAA